MKGPKRINVKVDWDTWKDEDEVDEAVPGEEDFNFNDASMGGGMDDIPDLGGSGKTPWVDDDGDGKGGDNDANMAEEDGGAKEEPRIEAMDDEAGDA